MENKEIRILAIDDNHDNLITIKALIIEAFPHAAIYTALSGQIGFDLAAKVDPDVILLDIVMPDMDGFEVCRKLKGDPELCDIPVVFVTALKSDKDSRIRGLEEGADAFLAKPIDASELIAQIKAMVKIKVANMAKRDENMRLASLVAERTRELELTHIATLNLLDDLRKENEARSITEDALRQSELRLIRAEIASKSGNWELHLDANKMFISKGAAILYGLELDSFEYDFLKLFPLPEYRKALDKSMKDLIERDISYDITFKIKQNITNEILDIHSIAFFDKENRIVFGVIQDVTAQMQAQEALLESETHFRTLANSGQALVWTSGVNKQCDYFNQPWLDFTGRTLEQEMGAGWTENVHPDDLQMRMDVYVKAFEKRERFCMEYRIGHNSGEYRWIQDLGSPRFNSNNEFIGYIGHCMDITENKATQNKILESEALYKAILDATPDNIIVTDINGTSLMVSESTLKSYNLKTKYDAINLNTMDFVVDEDLPRVKLDFMRMVNGFQTGPNEYRSKRPDGSVFDIEVKGGLIRNQEGEISRLVFIARDITERKKVAAALEASELKYRELIDNSPEGITIYVDAKIAYINKEALRLMGTTDKNLLLGRSILDFVHSDNEEIVLERMKLVAMAPVNVALPPVEEKYIRLDGTEFYAEIKAMPIIFDGRPAVQLAGRDITDRKIAEAKLIKSENEFRTVWENSANGLRLSDENGTILRVNKSFCEIFEMTKEEIEGKTIDNIYNPKNKDKILNRYRDRYVNGTLDSHVEKEFELINGRKKWFQIENSFLEIENGKKLLLGIFTEITERKQAEDRVRHLTRLYALLSQVNQAIVRINSIDELFTKICQVAVEFGQFQMAWTGLFNHVSTEIIPVAFSGYEDGYLEMLKYSLNDSQSKQGPSAAAIMYGQLTVCNNIESDERMLPWRDEALKRGYRSSVAVPIKRNGEVFGTLNLYASEIDFFSEDEQKLLLEIGDDISFAISVLDAEMVRKQTEQALIESENRYNTFINNNVDLIFVKDSQLRYLIANDAMAGFFGKAKDELIYKTDTEIADHDFILPCISSDKKALESEVPITFVEKLGDRIYETTKFKMPLRNGEFGIGGIMHDITNRISSEKALEESRLELKAIYDNAPVMMCVIDEQTNILFQNKEFTDFVNLVDEDKRGELIGGVLGCIESIQSNTGFGKGNDCSVCRLREAIAITLQTETGQKNFEYQTRLLRSGFFHDVYLLGSTAIIHSAGKKKILLTMYDITNRKEVEKALQKSEMFLRTFVNNTPFQIWVRDLNNVGILENKMMVDSFGSILGKKPTDESNVDPEIAKFWEDNNIRVMNGDLIDEEIEYEMNGKKINYHQMVFPINLNDEVVAVAGFNIDITEKKRAQQALQESQEQLKSFAAHLQNIREEERIVLAREIHDELGQILVAMKIDLGMLGLKASKFIKEDASDEFMVQFQRLAGLVDNTIKTARRIMTDLRPEVLDLLGFIETIRTHIKIFSERHKVTCVFETELTTLNIDTQRAVALFRILQESLNNIAKHAMATEVLIKLEKTDDSKIVFEIKDNGLGFDLSMKKRNDSYGLIGMKERAFLLDGNLTITSAVGKGTTVKIIMPYIEDLKS